MKNLVIVLSILLISSDLLFAIDGSGTETDPYRGTITTNTVWNTGDEIFADDIEITPGFTLTISPGAYSGTFLNMLSSTLTIDAGATFILNPEASATINIIVNEGTMILESFSNEVAAASLIHYSYSGSGISQMKLYLSGGTASGGANIWHYISTPIAGVTSLSFNTLNLARYVESLATTTDNYPGWIAYDGFQYSSGATLSSYAFNTLSVSLGYTYHSASSATFSFSGPININSLNANLTYTGPSDFQGYNLIGNPFSSCVNWDLLVSGGGLRSVDNAIYFTNRGRFASYVGGIGADGGTGTIPPLQGFFVKASSPLGRVTFNSGMVRVHNDEQMRYKKKSTRQDLGSADTISYVRLKLQNAAESCDMVVRFNPKATLGKDKEFDAYKFSKTSGGMNIWSTSNGSDFSINGMPFPVTTVEIPLGVNIASDGQYKISSSEIIKLNNYSLKIKDLVTSRVIDLKNSESIDFSVPAGTIEGRFILAVSNTLTDISETDLSENSFDIYSSAGYVNIRTMTDDFAATPGTIDIYDITGRKLYHRSVTGWHNKGELEQIQITDASDGILIVEIKAGSSRFIRKVSVK
ncbi:MAG TPA: hypothetical protein PL124_11525 [Candidatus Cloacimonadota bacterium]|nr:hypothetical protein [Candidatus Cloacimonadota bacterium]